MRKSLQKYVILLAIWGFHGGADNMEFFQMFVRVFTYKAMKLWKQMDPSSFQNIWDIHIKVLDAQDFIGEIRSSHFP